MNWQVTDAGCGYGDGGYVLAGRNIRRRDAGDCVIRTDLDTGADLIHDEPSSNIRTTLRDQRTVRIGISGKGTARLLGRKVYHTPDRTAVITSSKGSR